MFHILVADDDKNTRRLMQAVLQADGYDVITAENGEAALEAMEREKVDLVVLDIMMPKMDGITVLKKIRAEGNTIPVLMLTAKSEIEDKVLGLDSGANDYLPKPFDTRELLARIRSITRARTSADTRLTVGNVTLDRATFELSSPTGSFRLANKEYQMMEYLMVNPRRVLSTDMLMEKIWGYDNETEINVVWVYVSYLRKKLAALGANVQIKSSRNAGYSLEDAAHD